MLLARLRLTGDGKTKGSGQAGGVPIAFQVLVLILNS